MYLTTYIQAKIFPDNIVSLLVKDGRPFTAESLARAMWTKEENKERRAERKARILARINELTMLDEDKAEREKLEEELKDKPSDITSMVRSARRSRQTLYDIARCNDFDFFVTITFDKEKVERLNDEATRRTFTKWANFVRKKFPSMFYCAVPEYHKKGGLHYHLLVGGIKWDDLRPVFWKLDKHGAPIYSVMAWPYGFSTVSRLKNREAAKHYVCKYITKQHYDLRFFRKRRFQTSHNISRPRIYHMESTDGSVWQSLSMNLWKVRYFAKSKRYGVFEGSADGLACFGYNDEATVAGVRSLARVRAADRWRFAPDRAPARASASHLTIGTLYRKDNSEEIKSDWDFGEDLGY